MPRLAAKTLIAALLAAPLLTGCPNGPEHPEVTRPPRAQKWFERAAGEYSTARLDAAHDSARQALDLVPKDEGVRLLAGKVALARLEFDEVLRLLRGIKGSEASALRGRAYWYKGEVQKAADELEGLLRDPEVSDRWAKSINKLARRGIGRKPFETSISEGRLAAVEMARVAANAPYYVVPLEIDGEEALALIATGQSEVTLDSTTRREPSWVSLRFGKRFEVRDVPALTQDLTQLSTMLGAPIRALLGVNLLRHLNATMDFRGRQFVVRDFVPPPPPVASPVDLFYLRGGGMVLGGKFGDGDKSYASFFVDSAQHYNVMLDAGGWEKVGMPVASLQTSTGLSGAEVRGGAIPLMQIGAFKLPQIRAVLGDQLDGIEKELNINVDGAVGAGLLAEFRLTFADAGRVLWVEQKQTNISVPDYTAMPLNAPNGGTGPGMPRGPGAGGPGRGGPGRGGPGRGGPGAPGGGFDPRNPSVVGPGPQGRPVTPGQRP